MNNNTLLKITGADAKSFLQGQLTNDINSIKDNKVQLSAYCQHQGKIIALFLLMKKSDDFYLSFPKDLSDIVQKRLNMFVLMADVKITKMQNSDILPDDFEKNNYPQVYLATSEKFVPQDLNLDKNELGVSFTKGCYPGQEVVARLHYLGKPKRRMFKFKADFEVKIGDELIVKSSKSTKASGIVVRCFESSFFATIEVKYKDDEILINNKKITRIKDD